MQALNKAKNIGKPKHGMTALLLLMFTGTAFVINAYLAGFIFKTDPLIGPVSAAIGALLLFLPILCNVIRDLVDGELHMNELVALAILASMAVGDFKTAGVIAFFMLISLVIETRTAEGAHSAIEHLIRLSPSTARRLDRDGREEEIEITQLAVGDRLRILPGETVPADGAIESGSTTLNEATITGESMPRDRKPGEDIFAGTQNLTGLVEIRVTRIGEDTTLGRVRDLILAAEQTKLPVMRVIDRYVGYYTPVVLMLSALIWFFTGEWSRVISLLVISCPCALILATPTAMVAALSSAARLGILVKNVADLEAAARISAFIFDKTGTLTTGQLGVVRLAPSEGVAPSALLHAAASAERFSNHPVATALAALAVEAGVALQQPSEAREEAGQGVRAVVDGEVILTGRTSWLSAHGIHSPPSAATDEEEARNFSLIHVARGKIYLGWIGLQDKVRPAAADSLRELRELNIKRIAMVTGDRATVARHIADAIGCEEFKAECLPEQKVELVNLIKSEGYLVAFVGDGVNDAPALSASHTGIAMGAAGSEIAIHSATIALMNNDLKKLPFLIRLSRAARTVIHQNLSIGALFILGGLALSGLGLLNPILAAILHNVGSLIVVFNSARLVREEG